jgi:beta-lactamase class A
MVSSDFENRLPALLPKEVKIYHKIGSEIGNIHDVGIIEAAHPYYIGVFSNDITDDTSAETTIAQISKLVFDFMSAQ